LRRLSLLVVRHQLLRQAPGVVTRPRAFGLDVRSVDRTASLQGEGVLLGFSAVDGQLQRIHGRGEVLEIEAVGRVPPGDTGPGDGRHVVLHCPHYFAVRVFQLPTQDV